MLGSTTFQLLFKCLIETFSKIFVIVCIICCPSGPPVKSNEGLCYSIGQKANWHAYKFSSKVLKSRYYSEKVTFDLTRDESCIVRKRFEEISCHINTGALTYH